MATLALRGGAAVRTAPFPAWPVWGEEEIENLAAVIRSGKWGPLNGQRTAEFEQRFAKYQHARYGQCVNSGTTALRLALMAAGVDSGDEVIVPAYTFIASASAVIEMGAIPVFADIEAGSYNIDLASAESAVSSRTSAIMPVHFAGRPADMDGVTALAEKHRLRVVEDAAQAWGAEWRGKRVGALGDAGCFSFQSSKNINAGEGGIILTNDDGIAKMMRSHANCGRSEDGEWYEHFYFGGNARMTEFQSAVLLAQLDRYESQWARRRDNLSYLNEKLWTLTGVEPLADDSRITRHACHLYIFRYNADSFAGAPKGKFIEALRAEGIPASPGYTLPLYRQPVFLNKAFGPRGKTVDLPIDYGTFSCPETERACREQALWLTQNVLLGERRDMDDILTAIDKIANSAHELAG